MAETMNPNGAPNGGMDRAACRIVLAMVLRAALSPVMAMASVGATLAHAIVHVRRDGGSASASSAHDPRPPLLPACAIPSRAIEAPPDQASTIRA